MPQPEEAVYNLLECLDLNKGKQLALACSGGPDSMALALLAGHWAKTQKIQVIALTVDHGLRKESAAEAKKVGLWLQKRGIPHRILAWKGKKPTRNIQESARKARYRLMADYCTRHGIGHLLVAHTQDDQAETLLLRLARGSGVDGLSAMAPISTLYGLTLVRPLLDVPKADLLAYLKAHKQPYVRDPSNANAAYDRVKMRKLLPELAKVGLTCERLAKTAKLMARARSYLEEETQKFLSGNCQIFAEGYAVLRSLDAPEEIALRTLAALIMALGGHDVKPRLNELERLHAELRQPAFKGATLAGLIFAPRKEGVLICREPKAVAPPVPIAADETVRWDNRFEVTGHGDVAARYVGALTQEGWLSIARKHKVCNPYPDKKILYTLPALRDNNGHILAVPHLGFTAEKERNAG